MADFPGSFLWPSDLRPGAKSPNPMQSEYPSMPEADSAEAITSSLPAHGIRTFVGLNTYYRELQRPLYFFYDDGFGSLYFRRPFFDPSILYLGTVTGTRQVTVLLVNMGIYARSVAPLDPQAIPGVSVLDPETYPRVVPAYSSIEITFTVGLDGPSTISGSFEFSVGGDVVYLPIIGVRSVVFHLYVNWQEPITERVSYITVVNTCLDSSESRYGLSMAPRVTLDAEYLELPENSSVARLNLLAGLGKTFDVLQWHLGSRTRTWAMAGDTFLSVDEIDSCWYAGCPLVLFRGDGTSESCVVQEVVEGGLALSAPLQENWPPGAQAMPSLVMRPLSEFTVTEEAPGIDAIRASWVSDPVSGDVWAPEAAAATTYRGIEVLTWDHNWKDGKSSFFVISDGLIQHGFGAVQTGFRSNCTPHGPQFKLMGFGKTEVKLLREFWVRRRGRLNPFWASTGRNEVPLPVGLSLGQNYVEISYTPSLWFLINNRDHRSIEVISTAGQTYRMSFNLITRVADTIIGWTLEPVPVALNSNEVKSCSFLYLMRSAEDSATFTWYTTEAVELSFQSVSLVDPEV